MSNIPKKYDYKYCNKICNCRQSKWCPEIIKLLLIKNFENFKITVTVNENKVPYVFRISRGNPNDAAILEHPK
jgi:hypothetical protein